MVLSNAYNSIAADSETTFKSYYKTLKEMQSIRQKIKADDLVEQYDMTLTDEYNEKIVSIERYNSSEEDGFSGVLSAFFLPISSLKKSRTSSQSSVFYNTQLFFNAKKGTRNKKAYEIKQDDLKSSLKDYYENNALEILKLKLLYLYGLQMFAENKWKGDVWDILELEKLGTLYGFYGELTLTHCIKTKYKGYTNSTYSETKYNDSFSFLGLFNIRAKRTESRVHSSRSQHKAYSVTECDMSSEVFIEEGEESLYKYDIMEIQNEIEDLKKIVYTQAVFNMDKLEYIFSFENQYLTKDEGDNPFF